MIWGFVGGRDFDAHGLAALLESVPSTDIVAVGSGIGSEKFVREQGRELRKDVRVPRLRVELFDYDPKAPCFPTPLAVVLVNARTRLDMLIRLDQVIAYGKRQAAARDDEKITQALDMQVTDILWAARGGKLVLMGGGRDKAAREIIKRCQETSTYNNERVKVQHGTFWEVIEL